MNINLIKSICFHLALTLICYIGLPKIKKDINTDYATVVEVVNISELTNVKVRDNAKQKPQKDTAKKAPPKSSMKESKPEPAKPQSKAAELNAEKIPDKAIKPDKKKEEKKEEPKDKKEPVKKDLNFEKAILKSLEESSKKDAEKKADKEFSDLEKALQGETNKEFNNNLPMSLSEIDAIKSQISRNWNTSSFSGAADAKDMSLTVKIDLDLEGNVLSVKPITSANNSRYYTPFVESAIRAIKASSPIKSLPKDKFHTWKEIEFNFDASGMIY